jgi:hypothetical protein
MFIAVGSAAILASTIAPASAQTSPSRPDVPVAVRMPLFHPGESSPANDEGSSLTGVEKPGPLVYGGGFSDSGTIGSGIGVVIGQPRVYLVYWGSQWGTASTNANGDTTFSNDPAGSASIVQEFFKGLGTDNESWSRVMTQYCNDVPVGSTSCPTTAPHVQYPAPGSVLAGVWYDNSAPAPASASRDALAQEAVNAAAHFGNTTGASNRSVQYAILSPTGTFPDGFPSSFCAEHSSVAATNVISPFGDIAFANDPYVSDAGINCGANFVNDGPAGAADGFTITFGHEYAEVLTDMIPVVNGGGWKDAAQMENGDKCAWISTGPARVQNITLATGTFPVQSTFANDGGPAGACEISHP